MTQQKSQNVEHARIVAARTRCSTSIIMALLCYVLTQQLSFVEISGLVVRTTNNILKHPQLYTNHIIRKHRNSIATLKLQHHQKITTSTVLFYNEKEIIISTTSTSIVSPERQQIQSKYDPERKILQHEQQQHQYRKQTSASSMAHYYPASSQHKKVTSRKIQLRWITQTIQKLIVRNKGSDSSSIGITTYNNNNMTTVVESSSQRLLEGLELLCVARTQTQVVEAGRWIESANVISTQSIAIQERIIKATAMTGLLHIAIQIMDHMIHHLQYVPSAICQDAMSNGLRRAGRIQQLNHVLLQLGSIAQSQNKTISLISFNTYLAALCDSVTGKDDIIQQQRISADMTALARSDVSDMDYARMALDRAWNCISDLDRTKQTMAIVPDAVSYATIIQAAAYIGNQTIVDAVWDKIRTHNVHPNIVAYNARLRSVTNTGSASPGSILAKSISKGRSVTRLGRHNKRDQEILKVWDTEISSDPYVSSDKYTIDLLLLPLIRSGRVGDVESLLDTFIKRNSESAVSNAFTAFLLTVVAGGELSTARALFEMYILPTLSPVVFGDAGGMIRMVRPTTRHFNVLIEGYRKYYQNHRFITRHNNETTMDMLDATLQAWSLYDIMTRSFNARPDSYTTTSMMGLCQTSTKLSILVFQSITQFDIECSSVVLRAACKYHSYLSLVFVFTSICTNYFS